MARAGLAAEVRADLEELFLPPAQADLDRLLLRTIAELAAPAALALYRAGRPDPDGAGRNDYRRFVARILADPLAELYDSYPVVARSTCRLIAQWRMLTGELAARWRADRERASAALGLPAGSRIRGLVGRLSDRHQGGREVLALELESGARIVYKPRCLLAEREFARLVDWCRDRGLSELPSSPALLAGDGYGWVAWVAPEEARDLAAARYYYRAAGALLAVAHALRARDLHAENLVATAGGPVVVDAELLLQPRWQGVESDPAAAPPGDEDCLATGLLIERGRGEDGEEREWGGLQPVVLRGATLDSVLSWSGLGEDGIACRVLPAAERPGHLQPNVLRLAGKPVPPAAMADDLVRGFRRGYLSWRATAPLSWRPQVRWLP